MLRACESSMMDLSINYASAKQYFICMILECTVYSIFNRAKGVHMGCKLNPDMNVEPDAAMLLLQIC